MSSATIRLEVSDLDHETVRAIVNLNGTDFVSDIDFVGYPSGDGIESNFRFALALRALGEELVGLLDKRQEFVVVQPPTTSSWACVVG